MTHRSSSHRFSSLAICYRLLTVSSAFLALTSVGVRAQNSPVSNPWDCLVSGSRHGLAYITFYDDGEGNRSFSAVETMVPANPGSKPPQLVNSIIPFPPDTSTSGSQVFTVPTSSGVEAFLVQKVQHGSTSTLATNIYGGELVNGSWGFDSQGRIIGSFYELIVYGPTTCTTNYFPVSTNYIPDSAFPTNSTDTSFDGGLGFCQTTSIFTNVQPTGLYQMLGICYSNAGSSSTTTFPTTNSLTAIDATPTAFIMIFPISTNGNLITEEQVTFNSGVLATDVTFQSSSPYPILTGDPRTNSPDTTFCYYMPVFTNVITSYKLETICYTQQVVCTGFTTNQVNFIGKAVPGRRLTLTANTLLGNFSITGVPSEPLGDMSLVNWYGVKKQSGNTFYEFFSLTPPGAVLEPADAAVWGPNAYFVSGAGSGAAYQYGGFVLFSRQNRVAFALDLSDFQGQYESTRAVTGPFNLRNLTGNAEGMDSAPSSTALTNRATFHIAPQRD